MLKARTLTVQIARPAAKVYDYLVNPANLGGWTTVQNGRPVPGAGPLVWAFDGPRGSVLVHFTPPNPFFMLDYWLEAQGIRTHSAHVRIIANGAGSVLTHTSVQQPGIPDEAFASEEEWMWSDLLVLKSLLES
jgi:hypothetical protein